MDHQLPDAVDFPIVQTNFGPVRGRKCFDYDGNPYYSFVRVPYARITDRFQISFRNLQRWTEPMDCTFNIETDSPPLFDEKKCLYCNIYTSLIPVAGVTPIGCLRPVLAFIPGENATLNHRYDLEKYGPQYFMTEPVVLVVVSYRSGILGFAKVEDENLEPEVPGYAGYSDVANFFIWLENETYNFGGGTGCTTAIGQGSGASLIVDSLLAITNVFAGVDRVILQSTNGGTWLGPNDINIKEYAMFAGWAEAKDTEKAVLEMLKDKPVEDLVSFEHSYLKRAKFRSLNFEFMTKLKINKAFGGRYNAVMIGFNSNEGMMDKIHFRSIDSELRNVRKLLKFVRLPNTEYVSRKQMTWMIPSIKRYFFGDGIQYSSPERYMEIVSDLNHNIEILILARLIPSCFWIPTRVWLYRFAVDGQLNLVKKMHDMTGPGACFGDELGYLFKVPGLPEIQRGSLEELTIRRMVKMWKNFAKDGIPNNNLRCPILGNTGWRELGNNRLWRIRVPLFRCLNIGERLEFTGNLPELRRLGFWVELFRRIIRSR